MENITIGTISSAILFLVSLIGAIEFLIIRINKVFENKLKPIGEKLNENNKYACKVDLLNILCQIDSGIANDEQKKLCEELYDMYTKNGGNSYIKHYYERIRKEGKLNY